ncbi:MAG: transcription elongation factor GreA [Richelia sp. RM2_1_2]|nr:transcription elongation factor GreA [Richelia sp. RM2_1_2]
MSYPITKSCYEKLYDELMQLKRQRPEISARIDEARGHGDLKENAEYHAARDEQGLSEARIAVIEGKLSEANIIDPTTLLKDKVYFGSTLEIENIETGELKTIQIVSEDEVSVSNGKISINSPIAKEALSKKVGDTFIVYAPRGELEYEIINII